MEDYRTFWTNVTSTKVLVEASESENDIIDTFHVDEKTDIDYYDMEVSESRTLGPRSDINPSFTVSPILVMTDKPSNDIDNNSHRHESNSFSDNIDSLGPVPELESHEISFVSHPSSKFHEQGTTIGNHPSILITPPLRPRKRNKNKPAEKENTSTTQIKTAITSSTTKTTAFVEVSSLSKNLSTKEIVMPVTKKSTRTTSKEAITAINLFGGIMVNARKKSTPKLMDPKYIFTTEYSTKIATTFITEETTFKTVPPSTTITSTSTSTSTTTTTMTTSKELVSSTQVYSHKFDLTDDDSNVDIFISNGKVVENRNKTLYNVETTSASIYNDNQVDRNSSSLGAPRQRSDLYDVMVDENATEVITIGQVTELERMPRDNDQFEPLDRAYKRLEAQYGGWDNSGGDTDGGSRFLVISTLFILSL